MLPTRGGGAGVSSNSSSDGRRYVGRADIASGTTGEKDSTGQVQLLRPVSGRPSILQATPSNRITGDGGNNQLQGTKADDLMEAGAGNDYVMAGDGNDLIVRGNGEGDDVYIGGAGSDTIRYSSAKAGITVNLATGFAGTTGGGNAANIGTDHLSEIENMIGSHYSDHLKHVVTFLRLKKPIRKQHAHRSWIRTTHLRLPLSQSKWCCSMRDKPCLLWPINRVRKCYLC